MVLKVQGREELLKFSLALEEVFIQKYPESLSDLSLAFSMFLRLELHFANLFTAEHNGFL